MEMSMAGPRFCVVVRTQGRRPAGLRQALESLEDQEYSNFGVVVVVHGDGGVLADVEQQLGEWSFEYEVCQCEGSGRAAPLNLGFENADGDYLCFLDDDDLAKPDWLSTFAETDAEVKKSDDQAHVILRAQCHVQDWATDGSYEPLRATSELLRVFDDTFDLLKHLCDNSTPICTLAYPLERIRELDISFDETLPVLEDWYFLMSAACQMPVLSIPKRTSIYRRLDHGNSFNEHSNNEWQVARERVIAMLDRQRVILPKGSASRIAEARFALGGTTSYKAVNTLKLLGSIRQISKRLLRRLGLRR